MAGDAIAPLSLVAGRRYCRRVSLMARGLMAAVSVICATLLRLPLPVGT